MTKINLLKIPCWNCGNEHEYRILCSTNTLGSPDLDLRPAEMQRSTMEMWVQQCPDCGYCSTEVSDAVAGAADIIQSDDYQSLLHDQRFPTLARTFLLAALLHEPTNPGMAATSRLHAAWVCDDAKLEDIAEYCRHLACRDFAQRVPFVDSEHGLTEGIVYVDILRRTRQFDEAKTMIDELLAYSAATDVLQRILQYEGSLCDQQDTLCRTVAQIVPT